VRHTRRVLQAPPQSGPTKMPTIGPSDNLSGTAASRKDPPPKFARIKQEFDPTKMDVAEELPAAIKTELSSLGLDLAGKTVALTAGSRGVANIVTVLKTVVEWVASQGGSAFIVPAMGSHGGGTAEGQLELLEGYGITEEACGCEIRSSMEVVELPQGDCPVKVHIDKHAMSADHTIVINRVKPHTDFRGTWESGLMKMITIGLGKKEGAVACHDAVNKREGVKGLFEYLPLIAQQKLNEGNIVCAIGLVENAYDQTRFVKALLAADIPEGEKPLLELARQNMPRLPVDQIDVLMVDELGKNISGTGMDTNVIGRMYQFGTPEPEVPNVGIISVHGITEASHGNACGMGLADVCSQSFFEQLDFASTSTNIITSNNLERGKLPVVATTDEHTWEVAVRSSGALSFGATADVRAVRIPNTLHVGECWVSPALLPELAAMPHIKVIEEGIDLFCEAGKLLPFHSLPEGVAEPAEAATHARQ
jgi:hypothetical protein